MDNRYLPTNRQIRATPTSQLRFPVSYQDGNAAVIDLPETESTVRGELFLLDTGDRGIVTRFNAKGARLILSSTAPAEYAVRAPAILSLPTPSVQLYSEAPSLGTLSVRCQNTGTPKAGLVGWSLYRSGVLLAAGNDLQEKDYCSLAGGGKWEAGSYSLKVTSFLDPTQPIRRATRVWVLDSPAQVITCGYYLDRLGPLRLK